jgi:hypothetical protein
VTRARDIADQQDNLGGAVAPFVAGKNKLINADFNIWQRGTSFNAVGYTADRWRLDFGGTGASAVVTQQSFTPGSAPVSGYESAYFSQVVTTAGTDTGSYITYEQRVEDVRTFAGQTITVSFWARAASGTPKVGLEVIQNISGVGGASVFGINSTTKTLSTSWARHSFTFVVPALAQTAAQVGPPNTSNIVMNFWLSNGSSLTARSGNPGLQSNTFQFWGFQAEAGTVATPFQTATGSIGGELALCQRYYYRVSGATATNVGLAVLIFNGGTSPSTRRALVPLPATMRTKPSVAVGGTTYIYTSNLTSLGLTSLGFNSSGPNTISLDLNTTSAGGAGQGGWWIIDTASASDYLEASAEL